MAVSAQLEDLIDVWHKNTSVLEAKNRLDNRSIEGMLIKRITDANSKIRRRIAFEIVIMFAILIFAAWIIFLTLESISVFAILLFSSSAIVVISNLYLMLQSYLFTNKTDFSANLKLSIELLLKSYKRTFKFYLWSSYLFGFFLLFMVTIAIKFPHFFYWFNEVIIYLYIILLMAISKPYLNWRFGKEIKKLEEQLAEINS